MTVVSAHGRRARSSAAMCALMAAISVAFTWPLWIHIDFWGIQDWDYNYFKQAVAARSILEYRQLPLWNPWYYGGFPLFAEPESAVLSPTFFVHLAFGAVAGLKLEIVAHYFIGLGGMFVLARHHRMSRPAAITAAIVYMLSGPFAVSFGSGMTTFMSGAYIPWAFWAYVRSIDRVEYAFIAGAALSMMFLSGGGTLAPLTALGLGCYGLMQILFRQAHWARVVLCLVTIGICAPTFAAIKLLPTLELMSVYPKVTQPQGGFSVVAFSTALVDRHQSTTTPFQYINALGFWRGNSWGTQERGMYIGLLGVALVGAGVASRLSRMASLPMLASLVVGIWLSFGFRAPLPLWRLVHRLPVFESMRVPERFRFVFFVAAALFAGFAVDWLCEWMRRRSANRWSNLVALAIPALLFADYLMVNAPELGHGAWIAPLPVDRREAFHQLPGLSLYGRAEWIGEPLSRKLHAGLGPEDPDWERIFDISWYSLYPALLANVGTLRTDAGWPESPPAAVPSTAAGYRGELYVDSSDGSARYLAWSPNRIVVRAQLTRPGRVIVNQNHDPGWHADVGRVTSSDGLLAVELGGGEHDVVLEYMSPGLRAGFAISVASTAAAAAITLYLRRRRAAGRINERQTTDDEHDV